MPPWRFDIVTLYGWLRAVNGHICNLHGLAKDFFKDAVEGLCSLMLREEAYHCAECGDEQVMAGAVDDRQMVWGEQAASVIAVWHLATACLIRSVSSWV